MAITTGRFLSRAETFNPSLIQKIDSLTAIAFSHKTVQAYNGSNKKIYAFNDDRASIKKRINTVMKSCFVEEKEYRARGDSASKLSSDRLT